MKAISIDYGEKRIGLAISDEIGIIAAPMKTLKVTSFPDAVSKIHRISKSQNTDAIVIGIPLGRKGEETKQSIQARYFANALKATDGTEIVFWNEAFSTQQASKHTKRKGTKRRKNIDSEAARIILQEYLDSRKEKETKIPFTPQQGALLNTQLNI